MSLNKLFYSFGYAFEGVLYALKYNQNLRIHFMVAALVLLAGVYFQISRFEFAMVGVMIIVTIAAEMINTSIEQMVDLITIEHRREAKIAKDVAAGMVLVTATGSIIAGISIFTPYILKLFGM